MTDSFNPVSYQLEIAQTLVNFIKDDDRGKTYGNVHDNYVTAGMVHGMLIKNSDLSVSQKALLFMIIVKLVRLCQKPGHADTVMDAMNYLAILYDNELSKDD